MSLLQEQEIRESPRNLAGASSGGERCREKKGRSARRIMRYETDLPPWESRSALVMSATGKEAIWL